MKPTRVLDELHHPKLIRALSSSLVADVASFASSVLITRWLLHYLGESSYGFVAAVGSAVGYMTLLDMGLGLTVSKFVAEHGARGENRALNEVVSTVFLLHALAGLVAFISAILVAPFVPGFFGVENNAHVAKLYFVLVAAKLAIGFPLSTFGGVCYGLGRIDLFNGSRVVATFVNLALVWLAIHFEGSIVQIEALTFGAPVVEALIAIAAIRALFPQVELSMRHIGGAAITKLLGFSFFLLINQVFVLLVFRTDNLVIGATLGTEAVAAYAVTAAMALGCMKLVFKLNEVLYPTFSALEAMQDQPALWQTYVMATRYTVFTAVGTALLLGGYGRWVVYVWTGPSGFAGEAVMWTLASVIVIHAPVNVASILLRATGQLKQIAVPCLVEGLLNLGLSLWFVRTQGVFGVALATAVSMAVTTAWFAPYAALRVIGESPGYYTRNALLPAAIASIPAMVALAGLQLFWPPRSPFTAGLHICAVTSVIGMGFMSLARATEGSRAKYPRPSGV